MVTEQQIDSISYAVFFVFPIPNYFPTLCSMGTYLPPQLIEGFIEVEHPSSLPDVGSPALGHRSDSSPRLLAVADGSSAAPAAGRPYCR